MLVNGVSTNAIGVLKKSMNVGGKAMVKFRCKPNVNALQMMKNFNMTATEKT